LVEPKGARANSWEDVADLSAQAGVVLDEWQETVLRVSMGERADATWAAKRVGVSLARQNGKSQLLVARALAGALLFGEKKIVISAHQADTARETFGKMIEILEADGNGWLMDRVKPNGIMNAINRESIKFRNGATIQFKARTGAGGRGFSSDCLMLDEAQRLKRSSWVSINSTMSAMPNPQVWLLGTPPTREDDGEVFESIRAAAISGGSLSSAWAEWGVDPADPAIAAAYRAGSPVWSADVERLCWESNPAWNIRMNHDVVRGEFESYTREEFSLDRWGIWLDDVNAARYWSSEMWEDAGVTEAPDRVRSIAVAFSVDGSRVSTAGAVKHDGGVHVELVAAYSGALDAGVSQLADWLAERWRNLASISILGASGTSLVQALRDRGVGARVVNMMTTADYFAANAMADDAIRSGLLTHPEAGEGDVLDASVRVSDRKHRGASGQWGWQSTVPDGDETPVEAFCAAYWAARTSKRVPGRKQVLI